MAVNGTGEHSEIEALKHKHAIDLKMSEQKIYHEFTKKIYDQQVMLRNGFRVMYVGKSNRH